MKRILLLALLATPALAQTPMGADEFERAVKGKTVHFTLNGQPYGSEQYFGNRRVRWQFAGGECEEGTWYQDGPSICFAYDGHTTPACWITFREGGQLQAYLTDAPEDGTIVASEIDDEPLNCPGPDLGV